MKLLGKVFKTREGAEKRARFENGLARGEFARGDKAKLYRYAVVPGENGTWRVGREVAPEERPA